MFEDAKEAMNAHAMRAYPEPACGAICNPEAPAYFPVDDVADRSRAGFRIERQALEPLEEAHGALQALVISHPSAVGEEAEILLFTPSSSEMRAQLALAVPFGVAVCDGKKAYPPFWFGDQCPIPPLTARPFRHGVTDCYSLIRDWYRQNRNVSLPEFPRDWNWWAEGLDLYGTGFEQAGFHAIDAADAREGDSVLFRMRSDVPNHGGVVLDDGWMLHHPASLVPYDIFRVSLRQPMDRWKRHATHWLRREPDA